jgi:hypothetical protein
MCKRLEEMFTKKRSLGFKYIRRFETLKLKKRDYAGHLAVTISKILNKKNEVYTFFYLLKYKRQDIGRLLSNSFD